MDGIKKRNVLHSPHLVEIKKKKRRGVKNKIIFVFFGVVLLLVALVFVSRMQSINISTIEISGNKIIEARAVEDSVRESISGYYALLIPKTNFLLYPQNIIKQDLTNKFKRIKEISISQKNPQTLEVVIVERGIEYTYCGDSLETENEKCYFLDQYGYIFDEAPNFSGGVYFKFFGKTIGSGGNPIGSSFLPDKFKNLAVFLDGVETMELRPTSILLKKDGDLEINLGTDSATPKIILKSDADFGKLSNVLETAVTTEPLAGNLKKKFGELLYIDLRFGNKVYYKFK